VNGKFWKQATTQEGVLQELEKASMDRGDQEQSGVRERPLQAKKTHNHSGTEKLRRSCLEGM